MGWKVNNEKLFIIYLLSMILSLIRIILFVNLFVVIKKATHKLMFLSMKLFYNIDNSIKIK